MDNEQQANPIRPGITEALHPETGNGAALERDCHKLLLRLPDPSKLLESFLASEEPAIDQPVLDADNAISMQQLDSTHKISFSDQHQQASREEASEDIPDEEPARSTKAGKRLKKAVKALKKKEPPSEIDEPAPNFSESSLSPFTRWLKGLSGSEYVHPYDDDYGLHQDTASPGEGISETYADLLAQQGYKEQAISMYQRLIEKYPEKSGFFAAKIEALL